MATLALVAAGAVHAQSAGMANLLKRHPSHASAQASGRTYLKRFSVGGRTQDGRPRAERNTKRTTASVDKQTHDDRDDHPEQRA